MVIISWDRLAPGFSQTISVPLAVLFLFSETFGTIFLTTCHRFRLSDIENPSPFTWQSIPVPLQAHFHVSASIFPFLLSPTRYFRSYFYDVFFFCFSQFFHCNRLCAYPRVNFIVYLVVWIRAFPFYLILCFHLSGRLRTILCVVDGVGTFCVVTSHLVCSSCRWKFVLPTVSGLLSGLKVQRQYFASSPSGTCLASLIQHFRWTWRFHAIKKMSEAQVCSRPTAPLTVDGQIVYR